MPDYSTHCFDNFRTGWNSQESVLTPTAIKQQGLQQLTTYPVQGQVYAQPLLVHDIAAPGEPTTDFLIVATEENRVYAFDVYGVSSKNPVWTRDLTPAGERVVEPKDIGLGKCGNIQPSIGITSTPVIDTTSMIMYVCAKSMHHGTWISSPTFHHRLYAINLHTGLDWKPPVEISVNVNYAGQSLSFDAELQLQRPALLLMNETLYLAFGSHCDLVHRKRPYRGWVLAYNANTLTQAAVFPSTVSVRGGGGIWQSGCGLAGDGQTVYCVTGNGPFGGYDLSDSVLRLFLEPGSQLLRLNSFFTPCTQPWLERDDADLGAGGPMLLPDQMGARAHLLVTAGKEGTVYLLDRDQGLGGFTPPPSGWNPCDASGNPTNPPPCANSGRGVVNSLWLVLGINKPCILNPDINAYGVQRNALFGGPAYFGPASGFPRIYFCAQDDKVKMFEYDPTSGQLTGSLPSDTSNDTIPSGAIPVVSSNGGQDGVLWVASRGGPNGKRQLFVYDLTPGVGLGSARLQQLDAAPWSPEKDFDKGILSPSLGPPATVVNGRVYVAGDGQVVVFGLGPAPGSGGSGGSACFVAEAVESSASLKLSILRSLRDDYLDKTDLGRRFVTLYEKLSPPVARVIGKSSLLRTMARGLIVWPAFWVAKAILEHRNRESRK